MLNGFLCFVSVFLCCKFVWGHGIWKCNVGLWVTVKYDESFYLSTVLDIASEKKLTKVCCLEKPIADGEPSEIENERFVVWYQEQLYTSPLVPKIIK